PKVYTAGMAFVDAGGDHAHIVRNEGTEVAQVIAVRLVPAGQPGRIDVADPGNCPFSPGRTIRRHSEGPSTRALASSHVDDQRSAFVAISTRKAGEENCH